MKIRELKSYGLYALFGAIGALLMFVGDLCLSVIPASPNDSGLFIREAYLNGTWESWRLPLLLATGLCGMSLGYFTVRASYLQIKPQYRKTRLAILVGGVIYVATAGALHLFIGSLADWTNTLSPIVGREATIELIRAQYDRLMPAMYISYAGMFLLVLTSAFAVATKKTIMPRWFLALHMIVFQIIFVLIPDIRQRAGAEISTWDFVLSQGSGNAALCIWMLVNTIWAFVKTKKMNEETDLYDSETGAVKLASEETPPLKGEKVTELSEEVIKDIGRAFGYYDYGDEHGLIDVFPGREAVASFICGYVRMAFKSGTLYATSKNGEGYIAYKLPRQKVRPKDALPLVKGLLGAMKLKDLIRFARIMSKGGSGLSKRFDKEKKPYIYVGLVCVRDQYQGQGYMRKVMDMAFAEGNRLGVPVILDTDAKSKCDKYVHLGMQLAGTRRFGEYGVLYDLIKYPDAEV